jgi:hypothetical protein
MQYRTQYWKRWINGGQDLDAQGEREQGSVGRTAVSRGS